MTWANLALELEDNIASIASCEIKDDVKRELIVLFEHMLKEVKRKVNDYPSA